MTPHICFAGEVGLSGEIRAVNRIDQRIAEAEKLGFEKIIVSKYNYANRSLVAKAYSDGSQASQKGLTKQKFNIEVVTMGKVEEVYQYLFASIT